MKKTLSILCAVAMLLCIIPMFGAAAATTPSGAINVEFNDSNWTGDTAQITNGAFYAPANANTVTLTSTNTYNLGTDFSVTSYFRPMSSSANHAGEYCSMTVGAIELREYMNANTVEADRSYTLRLYVNGTEVGSYELGKYGDTSTKGQKANHYFTVAKQGDTVKVLIDNVTTAITATASGLDFSNMSLKFKLTGNWSNYRMVKGCVIVPNYNDHAQNSDVNYPDDSLIIVDRTNPDDANAVITYLNTRYEIPQGTANDLVEYNLPGTYFESDIWQAVPMISQEMIDRGIVEGGESCQATMSFVTSSDGSLSFLGTDCGGLWRSLDGGHHWTISGIGLDAAGARGIAIDPMNKNHVIIVGGNTGNARSNGIFVTYNAAGQCEWEKVLGPAEISGTDVCIATHNDYRIQIMYDLASYDAALGYCTTAYWSVENKTITRDSVTYNQAAMWKTTDGGNTWQKLENAVGTIYVDGVAQESSAFLAEGEVASVTSGGKTYLYVSNANGFYISTDGGKNWTKRDIIANAIDVVESAVANHATGFDGYIWASGDTCMYVSTDFGNTWTVKNGLNYPQPHASNGGVVDGIAVSSLDPDNIYLTWRQTNGNGYYSNDGGLTWFVSAQNKSEAWQPVTGVSPFGYWSNTNANSIFVIANGVWKSVDGGKTIKWNNSGHNSILIAGSWDFNVNNPNLISVSSQDYNGGFSTDGGKTWTYLEWEGKSWGGFTYGSYMLNEQHIIACNSDSWGGVRYLWITHDGGKTFENTEIIVEGRQGGLGALGHDNIAFMGEWRTDDYGYTWTEMVANPAIGSTGCNGVIDIDPVTGTLFGKNGTKVVYSIDNGLTWKQIANAPAGCGDLDYNSENGTLYVTSGGNLYYGKIDFNNNNNTLTRIAYNSNARTFASSVAVDPNNPEVVYVADDCSIVETSYDDYGHIYRSLDGGKTWTVLTRRVGDGRDACPDGGTSAGTINVNPVTGELFASTSCMGMWKIAAPAQWYLNSIATESGEAADIPEAVLGSKVNAEILALTEKRGEITYTPKQVDLETVTTSSNVEGNFLKVPNGVTIFTGDTIKIAENAHTKFTMPNGEQTTLMNTTTVKSEWNKSGQVCSGYEGAHTFTEPGIYSLYTINSASNNTGGYCLVTFEVKDPTGLTVISTEAELMAIANNLSGTYVLANDIAVTSAWTSIGTSTAPFTGIIYGNGYTVSGLSKALIGTNNGIISSITVNGTVTNNGSSKGIIADVNAGTISHVMVTGEILSTLGGAIAGNNSGTIEQCVTTAAISGTTGAIAGRNSGTVTDVYYLGSRVLGTGSIASPNTAYAITETTDYANLDAKWNVTADGPAVATKKAYSMADLVAALGDYYVSGKYVHLDNPNVDAAAILALYDADANVEIIGKNGEVKSSGKLVSGDTIRLTYDGSTFSLIFVIKGDINLNGSIDSLGALIIKSTILNTFTPEKIVKQAADIDCNSTVNSYDYLLYKQSLLGIEKLWK